MSKLSDNSSYPNFDQTAEASEILERLLKNTMTAAGSETICYLTYEENGARKNLAALIQETKKLITRCGNVPELKFLELFFLEQLFRKTYPLMAVSVRDLMENRSDPAADVSRLLKIFQENPAKAIWEKQAGIYKTLLDKIGIPLQYEDYQDLTVIAEPLLDAFSFWKENPALPRYRSGESGMGDFHILSTISRFHKESDIIEAMGQIPHSRVLCFAALEHLGGDYTDALQEWIDGYPGERQRNWMRNKRITAEEYLASPIVNSRTIYLAIKDGGNLYLKSMPYKTDNYGVRSEQDKYYYGRRAGYAPYEIFYMDVLPAEPDTTLPVLLQKSWSLNDLLDEDSRIWLPAFLSETIRYVTGEDRTVKDFLLPDKIRPLPDGSRTTLPVPYTGVPVPSLANLLEDESIVRLAALTGLTEDDFAAILPDQLFPTVATMGKADLKEAMERKEHQLRRAAYCLLSDRVSSFLPAHYNEAVSYITANLPKQTVLLQNMLKGKYRLFTTIRVDGLPRKDAEGKEIIEHLRSADFYTRILGITGIFVPEAGLKRPGILFTLQPQTTEDYMLLLEKEKAELPLLLQHLDLFHAFHSAFCSRVSNDYTCHGIRIHQDVYMPRSPYKGQKGIYIAPLYTFYAGFSKSYFRREFPDLKYLTKDPVFREPEEKEGEADSPK